MKPTTLTSPAPAEFTPSWLLSPGELLADELKHRGMTQTDFAARTSLSLKHINQVIKGHVPLTPDAAIAFERSLGIPATLWLQSEAVWRAAASTRASREALKEFGSWLSKFPLDTLLQREVIDAHDDVATRVDKVIRWFEVSDPQAFDRVRLQPIASFKRSQAYTVQPYSTAVWLRLAEIKASKLAKNANPYSPKMLRTVAKEIPRLTQLDIKTGFERAQELLAQAGVLLVFVEEISGTRISGASKSMDDGRQLIALTGRLKRLDSFWFALAHEIAHVLLHPKRATYIDLDDTVDDDADAQESEANSFASNLFISSDVKERLRSAESGRAIEALANEVGVAPFILAGQYGHMTQRWHVVGKMRTTENLTALLEEQL